MVCSRSGKSGQTAEKLRGLEILGGLMSLARILYKRGATA
ncbi:Uncharacterized protein dnm_006960 [Desulfonema magnum]|uniref:Uncharacterized protein n=1 Tax=Desulfonema magnum TaxID=45655 RepID=A0A975BFS7_9BACT|nr:Uncharacterized protein dnm_006960 [Desulfonema magnum]